MVRLLQAQLQSHIIIFTQIYCLTIVIDVKLLLTFLEILFLVNLAQAITLCIIKEQEADTNSHCLQLRTNKKMALTIKSGLFLFYSSRDKTIRTFFSSNIYFSIIKPTHPFHSNFTYFAQLLSCFLRMMLTIK